MTKDVLVSISGMHEEIVAVTPEVEEDENEAIEVVTPATENIILSTRKL